MSENNILHQLGEDWSKLRDPASRQLIESRKALQQLRTKRGNNPPCEKEKEIESLVAQLTIACQQIDAQFQVVNKAVEEKNNYLYEHHVEDLLQRLSGWHGFAKIGTIERRDFYRLWLKTMGIPDGNRDPKVLHYLAAFPKTIAACRAWETNLLFPRRVSSIMEVGSKFGVNALLLSRMARMGAIEQNAAMVAMGKRLEQSGFAHPSQPPIGFTQGYFQLRSASTIPEDAFDALWFHRSAWKQWIHQDGPQLISSLGNLARRIHFLFLTTTEDEPPRHDLLTPLYELRQAGEHSEGTETFRFFIGQRRYIAVAGTLFRCLDVKIHDPAWQGFDGLCYGAPLLPWNNRSAQLQTRRLLLGPDQVMRSFLKRTKNHNAARVHLRESEIWPSIGGSIPEIPTIKGRSEDDTGYHLLLNLNAPSVRLATPSLTKEEQRILVRSVIRILRELRSHNLHLNFLRLDNFAFTQDYASLLTAEFVCYEELEDPLDALLWLLRDLSSPSTHWHHWPIEPFSPGSLCLIPEEYQTLGILALRSKDIDQFLDDPLVKKIAL
ncbi:MAG: hypothetical protein ACH346_01795 [Chthoniobacterales bacterium]